MRVARITFAVMVTVLLLVPPWERETGYAPTIGHYGGETARTALAGGHAFILAPPNGRCEIAFARLVVEVGAAAVLTIGMARALRRD